MLFLYFYSRHFCYSRADALETETLSPPQSKIALINEGEKLANDHYKIKSTTALQMNGFLRHSVFTLPKL